MAADDIDEVDEAGGGEGVARSRNAFLARGRPRSQSSSQTMPTPTMRSWPTRLRTADKTSKAKSHAVVERAAAGSVFALVGSRATRGTGRSGGRSIRARGRRGLAALPFGAVDM